MKWDAPHRLACIHNGLSPPGFPYRGFALNPF